MTKHNDQERELFEAWYAQYVGVSIERVKSWRTGDSYGEWYTGCVNAWEVWQARAQLPATSVAVTESLRQRCSEILEWQRTGVLGNDAELREFARASENLGDLRIAESNTAREAYALLAAAPHPVSGEQPAAQDVSGLAVALEGCINELNKYQNTPHPEGSDGARDYLVLLMNARHALAAHRAQAQGGDV